ncbi:vesicular transport protein [Trichoderma ceciliae]
MFQRIKGAIDRTIAEEQARQQKSLEVSGSVSRSASTSSRRNESVSGRRPRPKDPGSDAGDSAPNPDPAIFEAAFVIDDSDEPSRAGTPKPVPPEKDTANGESTGHAEAGEKSNLNSDGKEASSRDGHAGDGVAHATKPALTLELRQKLRKLEKLESTYPELLRSYRVAHRRATAIEPFEKALRENTPLTSIVDPEALIEYLNQLKLKGDMVMDELKRVSADKDELKRKNEEKDEKLKQLQDELDTFKAGKSTDDEKSDSNQTEKTKSDKAAKESGGDGDFFSYDDEIPQLQAEITTKTEEIETLRAEVDSLKQELSAIKQDSAGLVESLEKSAIELSESREVSASQESLQTQLEARKTEIASLTDRLDKSEKQYREMEGLLETEKKQAVSKVQEIKELLARSINQATDISNELANATAARNISKNLIHELNSQIGTLKREKSEMQARFDEMTEKLGSKTETPPAQPPISQEVPSNPTPATTGGGGNKRKNKKKKGRGAAAALPATNEAGEGVSATPDAPDAAQGPDASSLQVEITKLKEEIEDKDKEIERLSKRRKTEEDLREEIETLQENLINIGQDHVEDKERIKDLENQKAELKAEITALQRKMATLGSNSEANSKLQEGMQVLQKDYQDLKEKSATLQSDLGAAQQLAQSRFKDLIELRDVLQKARPELKSLRQDSAALKTCREELAAKDKELNSLEKKEKELERNLASVRQEVAGYVSETKLLKDRLAAETDAKARLEEAQRVSARDLRRAEAEKIELSSKAEKTERELQRIQEELSKLRPRLSDLEEQTHKLRREKTAAQEETEFKTKQYTTAQGLLSSMRDQASEMTVQLKEAQSQARSLEEELGEVQHLLQERTREGETMRRLLADVDQQAESKIRDMRNRMETAIAERERLEDETSSVMRKNVKMIGELKSRVRELEGEAKDLRVERDELEERERSWRRRREELEAVEARTETETTEMRNTISSLRAALDASELQVRDGEKLKATLRKEYDSLHLQYDKTFKELKALQAKAAATTPIVALSGSSSGGSTSRTSIDSTRTSGASELSDVLYLKTILLQFLEQRDTRLRAQLVPVLGKLLKFDKADEKKWLAAVQHIEVR